jgi:phosphoribosylformimino-5-aminoimidazole carboxamide ribotide isomerase
LDLYPAIDLHAGQAVRAPRDDLRDAVPVAPDPVALAERFAADGAPWLHVVDLDRAFGVGDQSSLVTAIVRRLAIPVQVTGGVRDADTVAALRDAGAQRVLADASVVAHPRRLAELTDQFAPDSIGVALDVEDGRTWGRHWGAVARPAPAEVARRAAAAGVTLLAVTDVAREGTLAGADVEGAVALMRESGMEVLVSGGVHAVEDLVRIRDAGLAGAIVGRALHEGRLTLREALACSSSSSR